MSNVPKLQLRVARKPSKGSNSIWPEPYRMLSKILTERKLKENQNSDNELQKLEYSADKEKASVWTRLVRTVTTIDVLSPRKTSSRYNPIIDEESSRKKYNYSPSSILDDVTEITTIIERIRRRNKRDAATMSKRSKRSITVNDSRKKNNSSDLGEEPIPKTDKLYRHPKLSSDDRETEKVIEESVDAAKENRTNPNEFTDFYKRIWDIINGTRPRFKIVVPPVKAPRRTQAAIFKDEHAVSASEIEDLNLPYNMTGSSNVGEKKSLVEVPFDERKPSREDELGKYVKAEVEGIEDPSTSPFDKLTYDPDYINNPDEIPYDKIGSLSESKETADDQTADSPDEIDSEVENLNLRCDETIDESSKGNKKSSPIRESLKDETEFKEYVKPESEDVEKHSTLLPHQKSKGENLTNDDQLVYDPENIPYVEVPDYEDEREESLDEEDRRRDKERIVNPLNISSVSHDSASTNSNDKKDDPARINLESYRESGRKKMENSDGMGDNLNNGKNNDDREDRSKESDESDEESVLSAIHFDINEYKKPFNLDDFLKNEPFFAKFRKDQDYVRESSENDEVKEGNNSYAFKDNVSVDFADAEGQEPREEDHSNHDDYVNEETGSEEISEDLYRYGDKDFFKRLSEENRKKRENFEISAEEKDFLNRYFTKDVVKKMKEYSKEELDETMEKKMKEKVNNKRDMLKTLSSILQKKDRISRLDEAVNKEIEDGKNTPSVYKNYWSLEYVLPGKNDKSSN